MRRPREECSEGRDGERAVDAQRLEDPTGGGGTGEEKGTGINPLTKLPYSKEYYEILAVRNTLPVYEKAKVLCNYVRENQVVLLVGETGSGKTTQVPQFIVELGCSGLIACTQPRRIAAISVASRVATEMDVKLGEEVGYHVRFVSMMSEATKLVYMTDGMLLREAFSDHDLSRFGVVIVDEAHERTIDTDILLGVLRLVMERRPQFRLIVMSATLDMQRFQTYFPKAPLLRVTGRMYDVSVEYSSYPVKDYVERAAQCVYEIHTREPAGDILCFLTGEAEIARAVMLTKMLLHSCIVEESNGTCDNNNNNNDNNNNNNNDNSQEPMQVQVLPLYGSLTIEEQKRVFSPCRPHTRKVIFATNIAETSLTIDGIVYVIDCGYHKQSLYNSEIRVDYLLPALISKASAEQRKGRAGRTRPGKCFRLFREEDFATFPAQTHPEIMRSNLVNTVLLLLKLQVENLYQFAFIDPPSQQSIMDAYYQLSLFGAVDDELQLTPLGKLMAEFPVDACFARMLLRSEEYKCGADAAVIAAMLEVGNVYVRPSSCGNEANQQHAIFQHPDGDHLTLFNVFHAFWRNNKSPQYCFDHFLRYQALSHAVRVYEQLTKLMRRKNIPVISTYDDKTKTLDSVALRKTILEGFFTQVAFKPPTEECYKTVKDSQWVKLHRQSVFSKKRRPSWIVYDRLEVHGQDGTFIRIASAVEPEWLLRVSEFFTDPAELDDSEICHILQTLKRKTDD